MSSSSSQPQLHPTRFRCGICQLSFGRIEHLTRHQRSHSKERCLKCLRCEKGFYRLDALRRHELVHEEPKRSSLGKGGRACSACAAAKRKCSGGSPCGNCVKRGVECFYGGGKVGELIERASGSPPQSQQSHFISQLSNLSTSGSIVVDSLRDPGITSSSSPGAWPPPGDDADVDMNGTGGDISETVPRSWSSSHQYSINWLPDDWLPGFTIELENGALEMQPRFPSSGQNVQPQLSPLADMSNSLSSCYSIVQPVGDQISSPESQNVGETATGRYYVDGEGARLPHVLKTPQRIHEHSRTSSLELGDPDVDAPFEFPRTHYSTPAGFNIPLIDISEDAYTTIYQTFNGACVNTSQHRSFGNDVFPSKENLCLFLTLYLERFQPVLPFIHPATFSPSRYHWLMTLAMASIGSSYVEGCDTKQLSWAMHEFLRRAISIVIETEEGLDKDPLFLIQVKILSCVGMMYSGHQRLMDSAKIYFGDLINFCNTEWDKPGILESCNSESNTSDWLIWAEKEGRRRVGYSIWLLDCMWAIYFQSRPMLCLEDAKIPMPCQEVLWEAKSELDWQQLYSVSTRQCRNFTSIDSLRSQEAANPPLHEAVQLLYVEKRLQSSTGEFSRILCIHALIRRTWEVETYLKQPLALWIPTAEKQDIRSISCTTTWLPDVPTYQKWRNSACDCLDTLHWHANSVIGAASGLEHPTVLHLHLARVILLTPIREIVQLAHAKTSKAKEEDIKHLEIHIQRWATEDQYKARLAIIHAGVLFWHVRRYSIDAFYEPASVFLATLALWAYGTFAKTTPRAEGEEEDGCPSSMQLDRPADDELVQLFVKRGTSMRALVMGVGDLCKGDGPRRVLGEGTALVEGAGWCGRVLGGRLRALGKVCGG